MGKKTSDDQEILCKKIFFRFGYTVCKENIHGPLIMNIDQTRIFLILGIKNTAYEEKGIKQILIYRKDEKHSFTIVLSSSCNSRVLPIQSVWKEEISISLYTKNELQEVFTSGHQFVFN